MNEEERVKTRNVLYKAICKVEELRGNPMDHDVIQKGVLKWEETMFQKNGQSLESYHAAKRTKFNLIMTELEKLKKNPTDQVTARFVLDQVKEPLMLCKSVIRITLNLFHDAWDSQLNESIVKLFKRANEMVKTNQVDTTLTQDVDLMLLSIQPRIDKLTTCFQWSIERVLDNELVPFAYMVRMSELHGVKRFAKVCTNTSLNIGGRACLQVEPE